MSRFTPFLFLIISLGSVTYAEEALVSKALIEEVAQEWGVPAVVLETVCLVESDLRPYVVNVQGKSYAFQTGAEACVFVKRVLARGISNVDVGCMQINWRWHGHTVESLEALFDPRACLVYGAKMLKTLFQERGGWLQSMLCYHSKAGGAQERYFEKVKRALLRTGGNRAP
jgi:hypothetical protein